MIERYVSPVEFRRLISALIVVLGFIAIAAVFAFLIVPGQRYRAHTADESAVVAVQGEAGWLDPTDYLPARRQEIPPIDPASVMTANPELLARGKAVFDKTCATCHGPTGAGDGQGGKGLTPPPRNFTAAVGWKKGTHIEDIYQTLEEGLKGSAMVSYNYLRRQDRMALAHYVQSLGAFEHGPSDPKARAALEQAFSGSGEVIPNRIPVRDAIRRLAAEYVPQATGTCAVNSGIGDPHRAAETRTRVAATGFGEFARKVSLGVPQNGFAVEVDTYSASQWNQLMLCLTPH